MKLYTYWALGTAEVRAERRSWTLRAYGGSDQSLDDAKQLGLQIAKRAAAAVSTGQPRNDYAYAERALREEIIQTFREDGELVAAITRNAYGSLVLNTSRVMFIDVDYPATKPSPTSDLFAAFARSLWNRISGQSPRDELPRLASRDDAYLDRFAKVADAHAGLGLRVYRTAGGFRLLVTSQSIDAASTAADELLREFDSDVLYRQLCKAQSCFRARVTPKHWRCGCSKPPSRFPWLSAAEEAQYRQWEQNYERRARPFATCAYVADFGNPNIADAVQPILELHDRLTLNEQAPLA